MAKQKDRTSKYWTASDERGFQPIVDAPAPAAPVAVLTSYDGVEVKSTWKRRVALGNRNDFVVDRLESRDGDRNGVLAWGHFGDGAPETECYRTNYLKSEFTLVPPPVKKKVTRVALVMDKSSSMSSLCRSTLNALNKTIDEIALHANRTGGQVYLSLYEFGSTVRPVYLNKFIAAVRHESDYTAHMGMTALFDATGVAVEDLQTATSTDPNVDEAFLLIALTDGGENQSRKYNKNTLNDLMRKVQATDRWTLTFLLPPRAKAQFCRDFSIPEGNVAEWEGTEYGVEQASVLRSKGIASYMTERGRGETRSLSFYTTDASKITSSDLGRLDEVTGKVKTWNIEKEEDIQKFIEDKGLPYNRGNAFYQLTKKEVNVQAYKKLLIMEKGKKTVYAGNEKIRNLLGLPTTSDAKVEPGNHGNFDIFVQSTSMNRKLVRGTKLIYVPNGNI